MRQTPMNADPEPARITATGNEVVVGISEKFRFS
jgi:hypothetical protein